MESVALLDFWSVAKWVALLASAFWSVAKWVASLAVGWVDALER